MKPREASQRLLAVLATVLVMAAVAALVRLQTLQRNAEPDESEFDPIVGRMLSAAQHGDVAAYLDCLGGELRQKLAARLLELPHEQAAAELRGDAQGLKSFVTTDRQIAAPNQASLVLERIYADYNERHLVRLERVGAKWRIVSLTPRERFAPEIPYGTSVDQPLRQSDAQRATRPAPSTDADR